MIRPRWDAYWLEGILCCLLASYALAYAVGRAKNTSIATNFLKLHKPLLDDNFTLVGKLNYLFFVVMFEILLNFFVYKIVLHAYMHNKFMA